MIKVLAFFTRRNTIMVIQAGAVLMMISSVLTWITVTGLGANTAEDQIRLSGAEVVDVLVVMGIVGVASGLAASIARQTARAVVGAILLGAAVISLLAVLYPLRNPAGAAAQQVGEVTGTTAAAAGYSLGFGPWLGLLGAVFLFFGALALLLVSRAWPEKKTTKKYGRGGAARDTSAPAEDNPDEFDLWDGLSEGDDPTDGGSPEPGRTS